MIERQANDRNGAGPAIVDAFLVGDAAAMIECLAADATFHSPVTDYHGTERVAAVLTALVDVVTDVRSTRVVEAQGATVAFFTAALESRRGDGVLVVQAGAGELASEITLMIRPLKTLLAGIERMKVLLGQSAPEQGSGEAATRSAAGPSLRVGTRPL